MNIVVSVKTGVIAGMKPFKTPSSRRVEMPRGASSTHPVRSSMAVPATALAATNGIIMAAKLGSTSALETSFS